MIRRARWVFGPGLIALCGCEGLEVRDTSSLLIPGFKRSEVLGFVAGLGTTFAAVPDLIRMFRRRPSKGMNPAEGGDPGRLPDRPGLLRPTDRVAAARRLPDPVSGDG
jgi:hypothetical protein